MTGSKFKFIIRNFLSVGRIKVVNGSDGIRIVVFYYAEGLGSSIFTGHRTPIVLSVIFIIQAEMIHSVT